MSLNPTEIIIENNQVPADMAAAIGDAICEVTGWTQNGDYIYIDTDGRFRLKISAGNETQYTPYFNTTVAMPFSVSGIARVSPQPSSFAVGVYKSTSGTVTELYVRSITAITATPVVKDLTLLYVLNANGEPSLISRSNGILGSVSFGTAQLSSYLTLNPDPIVGELYKYAITKYADPINGAVFPELYSVVGARRSTLLGENVSFSGRIFRITDITMNYRATTPDTNLYAYPVSE